MTWKRWGAWRPRPGTEGQILSITILVPRGRTAKEGGENKKGVSQDSQGSHVGSLEAMGSQKDAGLPLAHRQFGAQAEAQAHAPAICRKQKKPVAICRKKPGEKTLAPPWPLPVIRGAAR